MAKHQIFAVYLGKGFIGIQSAPSADAARIRYAHRGNLAAGNALARIHAHPASAEELVLACRYCRRKKEHATEELCDACKKRDKKQKRKALIVRGMHSSVPLRRSG